MCVEYLLCTPQLEQYLPAALKLLQTAVSRRASQLAFDHAQVAFDELSDQQIDPGIVQACRVYVAGLQKVLDATHKLLDCA